MPQMVSMTERHGPSKSRVDVTSPSAFHIETVPTDAQVSVDGLAVGTSPVSLALPGGRYRICVQKDGYRTWDRQVRFDGPGDAVLRVELKGRAPLVEASFPITTDQAKEIQHDAAQVLGVPLTIELKCGEGVELPLILVPAGHFLMGSLEKEEDRSDNEGPQHEVTISRPFYVGMFPVTQAQYKAVTGKNPSRFKADTRPVEHVSWNEASEFCVRLTEKTTRVVVLPTEAQWEYACRAGSASRFSFGDDERALGFHGWYAKNSNSPRPVGKKKPNAWSLYDMHGNVCECCADRYGPYEKGRMIDPRGADLGDARVVRGGSWFHRPQYCRSACRRVYAPGSSHAYIGFRVVCSFED